MADELEGIEQVFGPGKTDAEMAANQGDQGQQQQQSNSASNAAAPVVTFEVTPEKKAEAAAAAPQAKDFETMAKELFGMDSATAKAAIEEGRVWKERAEAEPFANPEMKAINTLVQQGVPFDLAKQYVSIKESELNDLEFMILDTQLQYGITAEEAKNYVENQYKIGEFKEDDDKEKIGLLNLKIAAKDRKPKFSETKQAMLAPFTSREEIVKKQEAATRTAAWEPEIPKIVDGLKSLTIPVGLNKEGKAAMNFKFAVDDPAVLATLQQEAKQIVAANPTMTATAEGVQLLTQIMYDRAVVHNQAKINHAAFTLGRSKTNAEWEQILSQADFSKSAAPTDFGQQGAVSQDQGMIDLIDQVEGQKR